MPQYPSEKFQTGQPTRPPRPPRPSPSNLKGHPNIRSTPEYKRAARRWLSVIVATPVLLVTTYMLFDRVYGNKSPKKLVQRPSGEQDSTSP
ncbi:hypothetical protein N7468_006515 [Penicillium chermesinum]|uniref:Uncharacterized protein n=1 Tax=Penicillium chermesinum TaxID=63820 RepID=A0A9W9TL86_9EURO|nr:uncharacterized protein N7468_006515 [Penicillium chermesinum]KAJ5225290.1 hypothetical protein N7468_006515 [Penicillium chermesinum]